jgi:hypothetical protein
LQPSLIPHRSLGSPSASAARASHQPASRRRAESSRDPFGAKPVQLVVTAGEDKAGARDQVQDEEREAVLAVLQEEVSRSAMSRAESRCGALEGREGTWCFTPGARGMDGAAELRDGAGACQPER